MSAFQSQFASALLTTDAGVGRGMRELAEQPAFAVYRNTVAKACIDALEANFPAVARLVGRDWFRSAAAAYARAHLPADASLLTYGDDGFPAFVQSIPTALHLPWLGGVAQLDTLWRQVHAAADAAVLAPGALAPERPEVLATLLLRPHPATRWAWFPAVPVAAIWLRARAGTEAGRPLDWRGGGVLLTRPLGHVDARALDEGGCTFLDACRAGRPLGEAAHATLDSHPGADVAAILATLLRAGAFSEPSHIEATT